LFLPGRTGPEADNHALCGAAHDLFIGLTAALAGAPRIEGRVELEHRNQTTV
jgi:hypothetical protein